MLNDPKITPAHLAKQALVYVRRSTPKQVMRNAQSALRADSSTFTLDQRPARCAFEAYVPRLITAPSS